MTPQYYIYIDTVECSWDDHYEMNGSNGRWTPIMNHLIVMCYHHHLLCNDSGISGIVEMLSMLIRNTTNLYSHCFEMDRAIIGKL